MELAVEDILCSVLDILSPPGTATVIVFYRRAYSSDPADA